MKVREELRRFVLRYRGAFLSVGIFTLAINVLMLTMPFYMLNVFSRVLASRSIETLVMLTLAATVALLVQGMLDSIRSRVLVRVGITLDRSLSREVLSALIRGAASGTSVGAQRLRDVSELRSFLGGSGILSLFDAPFVPLYIVVIFALHPALGWVAVVGALLLFSLALINEALTRGPTRDAGTSSGQAYAQADGFLRNADALQAMGMIPAMLHRWETSNAGTLHSLATASDRAGTMSAMAKFLRMLLQVAVFGVGAYLFTYNEIAPGAMIAASILMSRALAPVEHAIGTWRGIVNARAAYGRLKTLLDAVPEPDARMSLPKPDGRLSVERVIIHAPGTDRMTLKGVAFELQPGEMLGVIGPSGAGKTTLGRALVGVLPPRMGIIRLDGADIYQWDRDQYGQHVGYLPQDVQLFAGTVAENIARMQPEVPSAAVVDAAKRAGVHDVILRLPQGYDTEVGEGGMRLSAGQRQHVALARALFGDPCLLVLDEPNSNLDSAGEQALVRAMLEARAAGTTVVVISHRPGILEGVDRLLVLRDGNQELFGSRAEVLARLARPAQGGSGPALPAPGGSSYPFFPGVQKSASVTPLRADRKP